MFGELEVWSAGRSLKVGTPRQQAVLAALVVDARRPVAIETLIDRVWGHAPPADPRAVLYSHLSRIRRLLTQIVTLPGGKPVRLERRYAGYVLDLDPESVDLHRFRRLVEQGGDRRHDDHVRAAVLAEALGLWRGPPLAGVPGEWAVQVRDRWDRRRLDAVVQWARIELRLGHPAAVLGTVPDFLAEHPLAEPLEAVLMRALQASGRGAEALDRYTAVRQRLAGRLGADPGPELRALHQAMLRGELPHSPPHHPDSTATPPPETSSGRTEAVTNDAPPSRAWLRPPHRRAVPAVLAAVTIVTAIVSGFLSQQGKNGGSPSSLSVDRAHELFAAARERDRDGRAGDAQATLVVAVRLYNELVRTDPDQNASPLAPAVIEALGRAGVDSSVPETTLRTWLANPAFTPYPAIAQALLLQGWRLEAPVFLDVIVWNYEHLPGIRSPHDVVDVRPDALRAAVLEASNTRHGTQVRDFERLLKP
ncbi:AfsR/SARP family transcriptional regulator [Amycolatopsis samaneae]|uniref:BTAD domain-containing putative transcriptional regulator n=1 Tax=Amycolatopsis samaneae TaxID=664691 RepID=A0ABW5GSB7_9PSEU